MSEPTAGSQDPLRPSPELEPSRVPQQAENSAAAQSLTLRARIVRTALRRPKTLEQAVSFAHLLGDSSV